MCNFCLCCTGSMLGWYLASLSVLHCALKRDHWHPKLSVVSKHFSFVSLLGCVPPSSVLDPLLLGGRVIVIGSSEPYAPLRILAFCRICQCSQPFPLCSCISSQGWAFPGLIKARKVFQFRVTERVQHINMLGQHYQPVSLLGVIDDGPSLLGLTNILSGCSFCLIGSFAAQIPTYLMLMMKSQESYEILVN